MLFKQPQTANCSYAVSWQLNDWPVFPLMYKFSDAGMRVAALDDGFWRATVMGYTSEVCEEKAKTVFESFKMRGRPTLPVYVEVDDLYSGKKLSNENLEMLMRSKPAVEGV